MQTSKSPVTTGNGFTVTMVVAVHPLRSVKVIVAVPADTPVITPDSAAVAMAGSDETQGEAAADALEPTN